MTVSGGRNVTVMDNTFANNGAWGTLFVPYPDSDKPVLGQTCKGTGGFAMKGFGCVYEPEGDALLGNTFVNDGYFANPSNSDFGQIVLNTGIPSNCFSGNDAPAGSAPANLEQLQPTCGVPITSTNSDNTLLGQVLCDTGFGSCPAGATYPKATGVVLIPRAHRPSDHAQPVPRRAGQRLVPRLIDPVGVRSGTDCGGSGVPCAVCS